MEAEANNFIEPKPKEDKQKIKTEKVADEEFSFDAPRKADPRAGDAPIYEDFSFSGEKSEKKEEKAVKKPKAKPKAKIEEPLDSFSFNEEDKYKANEDDFSFEKPEPAIEEKTENVEIAKAEKPAEEEKFMFDDESKSEKDEFAFFSVEEEPAEPLKPEPQAATSVNTVSFTDIPEASIHSVPLAKQEEKPVPSDIVSDKADFSEPEPEVLGKKEQKKLEKERVKHAQIAQKEREEAERRKWSTYHHGFVLADGEKVIKEYNCLKLINPSGDGYIILTNKRLLCSTNELAEIDINTVKGIRSKYKTSVSFGKLFFFFLLGAIAAASFMATFNVLIPLTTWVTPEVFLWLKFVLWGAGGLSGLIALFLLAGVRRKEFHIEILTSAVNSFVSYVGLTGKAKNSVIKVHPGKESKTIVHEIGALLLEIKSGKY
jgi:hypothetical protein